MLKLTNKQLNVGGGEYQNVNNAAVKAITRIKQFNSHVFNLKLVLLAIVAFFVHLY